MNVSLSTVAVAVLISTVITLFFAEPARDFLGEYVPFVEGEAST